MPIHFHIAHGSFHTSTLLSDCYRNHVAYKLEKIYYKALYKEYLAILGLDLRMKNACR